jgi:allophanate hydrolase
VQLDTGGYEDLYRRIASHATNPVFIHLLPKERVLARARELEALPRTLPLWGRPFAVKDNIDVAGLPTTAACPAFSYVAETTAPSVQRLLDAGAVLIGKTNLDQFATGLVGTRSPYGACRNAFDPAYISGGSSSGSALAVALDMASFSLGTDTAGSGRIPAAFNNLVGLKPTRGLISTRGVVPACRSLDCVSIFAKTCRDAAAVLEVAQGFDPMHPYSRAGEPVSLCTASFRFGVPRQLEFHGDRAYESLFAQALERLVSVGGQPVQIDFAPFLEVQALLYGAWVSERTSEGFPLEAMLPITRKIVEAGGRYSASEVFKAQHRLAELTRECSGILSMVDVLAVPSAPTIYRIAEVEANPVELNSRLGRYTNFVNLLDLTAISVPAGFRPDGLPFGITLIGPAFSDMALAALGARYASEGDIAVPRTSIKIAVVGAHLTGMPLNHQLTSRGAKLARTARTAPLYRLYAIDRLRPGLVRQPPGARIEVEVWELPNGAFGSFVDGIAPPLSIGTVELEDGESVKGFLCEYYASSNLEDISRYGSWRSYVQSHAT